MAAFAAARRASGVCGAGAGGFTLAASYTSCAPSGTNPALRAASSPWIAASAFAASSASLTRPRPTRRATSSITAVPAALQFAPSLYEASLCSSANTRGKATRTSAMHASTFNTMAVAPSALRNTTLRTISSTGRNTMAPNVAHCRIGRIESSGPLSSAFTLPLS